MCNIDWERVFAEWRTQRQLDYEALSDLLARAHELAQDNGELHVVLCKISDTITTMGENDQKRFLGNGMTRPVSALEEGEPPH